MLWNLKIWFGCIRNMGILLDLWGRICGMKLIKKTMEQDCAFLYFCKIRYLQNTSFLSVSLPIRKKQVPKKKRAICGETEGAGEF